MLCGGFKESTDATSEQHAIVEQVKGEILVMLNEKGKGLVGEGLEVKAISFTTQVVAGTNYIMKIAVSQGGAEPFHAHCKIFKPLPHTNQPPTCVDLVYADIDLSTPIAPI